MKTKFMKLTQLLALFAAVGFFSESKINAQQLIEQNGKYLIDMKRTEIVTTFLEGFNNPEQLPTSISFLADDYRFEDPMYKHESKAEFLASIEKLAKVLTGLKIIRIAENENWVAVMYEFYSSVEGLESTTGVEWFRVESGLIQESKLLFDATHWRKVFEEFEK